MRMEINCVAMGFRSAEATKVLFIRRAAVWLSFREVAFLCAVDAVVFFFAVELLEEDFAVVLFFAAVFFFVGVVDLSLDDVVSWAWTAPGRSASARTARTKNRKCILSNVLLNRRRNLLRGWTGLKTRCYQALKISLAEVVAEDGDIVFGKVTN